MHAETPDCDVLIAGGGPVGATLALALRDSGLQVHLVEPPERRAVGLRPIALSHGSRQILESLGAWDANDGTAIRSIHVSQSRGFGRTLIRDTDLGVPALGHVVNLDALAAALKARCAPEHRPARVVAWHSDATCAHATLDSGQAVRARLLVLADGGQSTSDGLAMRDYEQSAIVGLIRAESLVPGCAWERFTPEGPLALLPLGDQLALVWTVARAEAAPLLALGDDAFLQRLQARFGDRLGRFIEVSNRAAVPLRLRFAGDCVAGARALVIGNAAQTLHPVAGQGLNLGLRDAAELAALLRAIPHAKIGDGALLAAYRTRRRIDRGATISLTDTLIRVFSNDDGMLRLARGAALTALDLLPPARRFFARRMIYGARALP